MSTQKQYTSQSARDAQRTGYDSQSYWDYLEAHALELKAYFTRKGDLRTADEMLNQDLSETLSGNNGD